MFDCALFFCCVSNISSYKSYVNFGLSLEFDAKSKNIGGYHDTEGPVAFQKYRENDFSGRGGTHVGVDHPRLAKDRVGPQT